MFQVSKKIKVFSFIATVVILSMSLNYFVFAWTEPSSAPPAVNVSRPINTSIDSQVKNGRLDVTELYDTTNPLYYIDLSQTLISAKFAGNVGIGTSADPGARLEIVNFDNGLSNILKVSSLDGSQGVALGLNYISKIGADSPIYIDANGSGNLLLQTGIGVTGNVGIGTAAPQSKLDVEGGAVIGSTYSGTTAAPLNGLLVEGRVGIGEPLPSYALDVAGGIEANAFYYSSDEKLKENIQKIDNSLEKITKLNGISFTWKESGEKGIGLVAQNVETVFPELVKESETSGMKSVEYGNLVAPMIEAIKEQQKMIENLQKEIEILKSEAKK